jgi:hypothetical protein
MVNRRLPPGQGSTYNRLSLGSVPGAFGALVVATAAALQRVLSARGLAAVAALLALSCSVVCGATSTWVWRGRRRLGSPTGRRPTATGFADFSGVGYGAGWTDLPDHAAGGR